MNKKRPINNIKNNVSLPFSFFVIKLLRFYRIIRNIIKSYTRSKLNKIISLLYTTWRGSLLHCHQGSYVSALDPDSDDIPLLRTVNEFSLANSFWFTIGTLMQQGSDLNPKVNVPPQKERKSERKKEKERESKKVCEIMFLI